MVFANPNYLYLLLLLIPMIGWYVYKLSKSQASLQVSSSEAFEAPGAVSWIVYLRHVPFVLRMVAVALLIVILARPQSTNSWSNSSTEGIDIMLAMDISGSMLAQDLKPNRLEAAKDVAASFINGRPNDNIGLVVFSAESFTQCPLTTDHTVLLNLFKDIQSGMIQDGTAIGLGLANAVSRIKDSHAKSKVIILLTDGSNNGRRDRSGYRCRDRQDVRRACLYDRSRNERHGAVSVPDRFRRAVPEYTGRDRRGYVEADRLYHGRAIFPCYGQRQPEGDLFRDRPDGEDQDQRTRVQQEAGGV